MEETIKKYFSELAKKSHKKSPRSKEFYSKIGTIGAWNRWKKHKKSGKKLSTA